MAMPLISPFGKYRPFPMEKVQFGGGSSDNSLSVILRPQPFSKKLIARPFGWNETEKIWHILPQFWHTDSVSMLSLFSGKKTVTFSPLILTKSGNSPTNEFANGMIVMDLPPFLNDRFLFGEV